MHSSILFETEICTCGKLKQSKKACKFCGAVGRVASVTQPGKGAVIAKRMPIPKEQ